MPLKVKIKVCGKIQSSKYIPRQTAEYVIFQGVRCGGSKTMKMLLSDQVKCPQFRNSENQYNGGSKSIHFFVVSAGDFSSSP